MIDKHAFTKDEALVAGHLRQPPMTLPSINIPPLLPMPISGPYSMMKPPYAAPLSVLGPPPGLSAPLSFSPATPPPGISASLGFSSATRPPGVSAPMGFSSETPPRPNEAQKLENLEAALEAQLSDPSLPGKETALSQLVDSSELLAIIKGSDSLRNKADRPHPTSNRLENGHLSSATLVADNGSPQPKNGHPNSAGLANNGTATAKTSAPFNSLEALGKLEVSPEISGSAPVRRFTAPQSGESVDTLQTKVSRRKAKKLEQKRLREESSQALSGATNMTLLHGDLSRRGSASSSILPEDVSSTDKATAVTDEPHHGSEVRPLSESPELAEQERDRVSSPYLPSPDAQIIRVPFIKASWDAGSTYIEPAAAVDEADSLPKSSSPDVGPETNSKVNAQSVKAAPVMPSWLAGPRNTESVGGVVDSTLNESSHASEVLPATPRQKQVAFSAEVTPMESSTAAERYAEPLTPESPVATLSTSSSAGTVSSGQLHDSPVSDNSPERIAALGNTMRPVFDESNGVTGQHSLQERPVVDREQINQFNLLKGCLEVLQETSLSHSIFTSTGYVPEVNAETYIEYDSDSDGGSGFIELLSDEDSDYESSYYDYEDTSYAADSAWHKSQDATDFASALINGTSPQVKISGRQARSMGAKLSRLTHSYSLAGRIYSDWNLHLASSMADVPDSRGPEDELRHVMMGLDQLEKVYQPIIDQLP